MQLTQTSVHKWGRINRLVFDATKEQFLIIHPLYGEGATCKLLGNVTDCKLVMSDAIDSILSRSRPKITVMLRTRGKYDVSDMIIQYKIHIWGHSEYQNGCIMHACRTLLGKLDSMQRRFVYGLHLCEESAFCNYNFAPPSVRRDIGMLGLIHKRVLGQAHPAYEELLPLAPLSRYQGAYLPRYARQLDNGWERCELRLQLFNRTLFGMVEVYNRLPARLVYTEDVASFQSELTAFVRHRCSQETPDWKDTFQSLRFLPQLE